MSDAGLSPKEAAALKRMLFDAAETHEGEFDDDIFGAAEAVAQTINQAKSHEERIAELEMLVDKPPEATQ
jgi:hypothetical protein